MSFSRLSTELDVKILKYLHDDRQALSAMSMASKYFRTVAEPISYRDLAFPEVTDVQIKRLLMTVLDRKELAGHIRSVTISIAASVANSIAGIIAGIIAGTTSVEALPMEAERRECRMRLRCYMNRIRELLRVMRLFCPPNQFIEMWQRDILNEHLDVERDTRFDGALALIIIQAINLRTLQLATTYGDSATICRTIVGLSWQFYNPNPALCPFNKLEDLCVRPQDIAPGIPGCSFAVSVPRSVRNLQLAGCSITQLKAQDTFPLALQTLDLQNAYVLPEDLIKALEMRKFINLRRLNLDGIRDPPDRMGDMSQWEGEDSFDCRELREALCTYTSQLEELNFRSQPYAYLMEMWPLDFGSLEGLEKLRVLRIHIDRLIHGDGFDETEPYTPHLALPESLRHLEIVELPIGRINAYCAQPVDAEKIASGMQFIIDTARSFPLELLEVGICTRGPDTIHGSEEVVLTSAAVNLLKGLVKESMEKRTVFQVYNGGEQKKPKCVLFGPRGLDQAV